MLTARGRLRYRARAAAAADGDRLCGLTTRTRMCAGVAPVSAAAPSTGEPAADAARPPSGDGGVAVATLALPLPPPPPARFRRRTAPRMERPLATLPRDERAPLLPVRVPPLPL